MFKKKSNLFKYILKSNIKSHIKSPEGDNLKSVQIGVDLSPTNIHKERR